VVNEVLEVDDATKGVKNVLVYIPKPTAVNPDAVKAVQSAKVVFDQKNCVFKPHVLGFMKGQTLDITSSDPVGHNVNAKMRANGASNNLLAPGQKTTFIPKASEGRPAEVTCDIHPWMKAYWLILDNPYFAVTNEKGEFEIKLAPAGTQKVVAWQESVQYITPAVGQDVNIAKDGVTEVNFKVDAGKAKVN
jgi:plastocyanin